MEAWEKIMKDKSTLKSKRGNSLHLWQITNTTYPVGKLWTYENLQGSRRWRLKGLNENPFPKHTWAYDVGSLGCQCIGP